MSTFVLMRHRRCPSSSKMISPSSLTTAYSLVRYLTLFISCVTKIDDTSSRSRSLIASSQMVRAVGGYRASSIGEDFDLVARMHRHLLEKRASYQIRFVPDPMCWTEVPSDLKSLGRQRQRWQKGLLDVLWPNRDMLFRPRYGRIGCFALPYLWIFELFAPVFELAGIATIILAASLGVLSREFFLQFLIFGYAFATVISIGSVLQEEITYKRYNDWQDVVRLVSYCFLEHFPYRQMHMIWRLQGLWQYFRGDFAWKPLKRKGIQSVQAP